jgi:hypothetical protein
MNDERWWNYDDNGDEDDDDDDDMKGKPKYSTKRLPQYHFDS